MTETKIQLKIDQRTAMKDVGTADPVLIKKRDRLKSKLDKLTAESERADKTDIPGTLVSGGSGVPKSRLKRIGRQLDRTIDRAVEYTKTKEKLDIVETQIQHQKDGPERQRTESKIADIADIMFKSIEVGDKINIGGNDIVTVTKVNKKTIVTGDVKWESEEIYGIQKPGGKLLTLKDFRPETKN